MANNQSLGRGLGSLIPDKNQKKPVAPPPPAVIGDEDDRIQEISIEKVKVNPQQPRQRFDEGAQDDLINSIKEHGVIQPLIMTRSEDGYELIAGERRLRAAKAAGYKTVPAVVREAGNQAKLEMALIENVQREDLNPIELAKGYEKLTDEFGLTQEEVAHRVGKSRPVITNAIRLLELPEEVQLALMEGKITDGHAKYIMGLEGEEKQLNLFRKVVRNNMTVRDTTQEVRRMGGTKQSRVKINYQDKDKEFALREFFGTKAEIRRRGKGGQVLIDFFSDDELENIISKVKK